MIENRANLTPTEIDRLETTFGRHATLEEVFRWGLAQLPTRSIFSDVVAQDEFSHDVVLPLDPPFARTWLVLAATCLGGVASISAWDHRPSAEELLDARLARGWRPASTPTRTGPQVLGYGAKALGQRPPAGSAWAVRRAG